MDGSFAYYMLMAFLGGVLLNVMPCVLPVLTMKVFHMIAHRDDDAASHRAHGVAYGAGVMAPFLLLSVAVVVMRASGDALGWGMQFQNPAFVAVMTSACFVLGLNALGVFEFNVSMHREGGTEGLSGSFMNGVIAAIMSTPCSFAVVGVAVGFALGADTAAWQTIVMFSLMGLGLAFPFVLVSFVPSLGRFLPKPGAWMENFKHLMGFTLIGAALWLYKSLMQQLTVDGAVLFLGFLLVVSVLCWAYGKFAGPMAGERQRLMIRVVVPLLAALAAWQLIDLTPPLREPVAATLSEPAVIDGEINWQPFDLEVMADARRVRRPVFMDFTADWCMNCKTNERLFIEVPRIREILTQTGIVPMKADLTVDNEQIEALMAGFPFGGSIPVYVVYFPDGSEHVIGQSITTEMLADALLAASDAYPPSGFLQ